MSRKDIYAASYEMQPADKKEILEELRGNKAMDERARKLGLLLKEEKIITQDLKRKNIRLEADVRRLREALAAKSRDA